MPNFSSALLCFATTTLLILLVSSAIAQEKSSLNWPIKLDKKFNKTIALGSQQVVLKNKFGAIQIETWDSS